MSLIKRGNNFFRGFSGKKGQITLTVIWKIVAIIGLVVGAVILYFIIGYIWNYLARFYDCMRFGGCGI